MFDNDNILFLKRIDSKIEILLITYDRTDEKMKEQAYARSIDNSELKNEDKIPGVDSPLQLLPKWVRNHINSEGTRTFEENTNVILRAYEIENDGSKRFIEL